MISNREIILLQLLNPICLMIMKSLLLYLDLMKKTKALSNLNDRAIPGEINRMRMISFIKFIGICSIGWFMACDPTTSSLNEINTHHLGNQLEKAYQSDSEAMLKDFFKTWKAGIPAYSDVEIADFSKEVRQVYAIFKEFYSPT